MAELTYVCFYRSYRKMLAGISNAARGRLVMAMLDYAETGEEPKLSGDAKILWPVFQFQIDHDKQKYREKCEKNRINGAKGGSASRKATASDGLQTGAKEKENEKANEKEKARAMEKESDCLYDAPADFPPSLEEVQKYAREQGYTIDAAGFMDHYTANGWMVGRNPMRDWKAALRSWSRKEHEYGKTDVEPTQYVYGTVL